MDRTEAQIQGIPWTNFKEIPQWAKTIYDVILTLEVPGLKVALEQQGIYQIGCEHWFNNLLLEATGQNKEEEENNA